jgi:hypothetical protein
LTDEGVSPGSGGEKIVSGESKQTLRGFISDYWRWIALLTIFDSVVWIAVEHVYVGRLWDHQEALWSVRTYLASGLLLFDNLCVLWWYADSTRRQVQTSEQEAYENRVARWRENKPTVFIELSGFVDCVDESDEVFSLPKYVIRNTGNGPALNVFLMLDVTFPSAAVVPLGALGTHEERPVDYGHNGEFRYVIIAEGLPTRTRRWNATLNLGVRGSNQVVHGLVDLGTNRTMGDDEHQTLDQFIDQHRQLMAEQLYKLDAPKQGQGARIQI